MQKNTDNTHLKCPNASKSLEFDGVNKLIKRGFAAVLKFSRDHCSSLNVQKTKLFGNNDDSALHHFKNCC